MRARVVTRGNNGEAAWISFKRAGNRRRSDHRADRCWCLRVKLVQNRGKFSNLLLATGDRPIVEDSRKDEYWGARVNDTGEFFGKNILGRLLGATPATARPT
ncbi:NADAR family protein [Rhizobium gallicum]|uniref:NADAR family protein n=1 Tax=Rhizobium gallicum TaxID=56730 RepID=UPI0009E22481|nr:NADAR family protein [Rhizobium gallicum]